MDNKKRFLITTADERSWKLNQPVLFLGEWCCCYNRKSHWSKMDAIIAAPYGVTEDEQNADFLFVKKMKAELLLVLTNALNKHHKTEHSTRYWRILLGHWLHRYVTLIVNRYSTLQQLFRNYNISETVVFDLPNYSLATYDSDSFLFATNDDLWNHFLYSKLFKIIQYDGFISKFKKIEDSSHFVLPSITKTYKNKARGIIENVISNVLGKMCRGSDAFIINSYLPIKKMLKLHLLLGQIPQFWRYPSCSYSEPDIQLRETLRLNIENHSGLDKAICLLLFDVLPSCYLEGYKKLLNETKALSWPTNPNFIFTSNNFDTDELFKAWAGDRVEQGVPFYLGQHGNNYGTMKICPSEIECVETADKFITWGWKDENPKCAQAFIFKTIGKKKQQYNKNGGLLLIEVQIPPRIETRDTCFIHGLYQKDQFSFVSLLKNDIQSRLTVRLHDSFRQLSWCDDQRWRDQFPSINIEKGNLNIQKLISDSRIVVQSYDSTGMLETLALNIPTICFWDHNFHFIRDSAHPYYEQLRDVGIVHTSPESAAKKISEIWDNVDEWWESKKVQSAREAFCEQYARMKKKPVRTLKRLLTVHERRV